MKIKKTFIHSKKTKTMVSLSILLVLTVGLGAFFYFSRNASHPTDNKGPQGGINSVDYSPPTTEQKRAGDQVDDPTKAGSDPLPDPTPQDNGKGRVDVTITSLNTDRSDFHVSFLISAVDNTGKCALTLTKGSVSILKEADVQALPHSSTCKGFSIPPSELSVGQWELSLVYENDSLVGTINKTVWIE
jgi:hypothetical protein